MKHANELFKLYIYREYLYTNSNLSAYNLKLELNKNAEDIMKYNYGNDLLVNLNKISNCRAKINFELFDNDKEYNDEIRKIIEASIICGYILNKNEDYLLTFNEKLQKHILIFQEYWKYFYQQILCCNSLYLD